MSSSLPYVSATDYDGAPVLVEPEIKRLDGEVREVSVPPVVPPVTHGSLADLPFDNAAAAPQDRVLSRRAEDGSWSDVTTTEFAAQVQALARGLVAEGLQPGDRIAVMARTIYEWTLLDFAAWAAGLVTVPVYPTSSVFQTRWILQDSGAVALVTETVAQASALGPELNRLPDLRHLWVVEKGHVERLAELGRPVPEAEIDVRRGMLGPDTLATVIYTSGTTGRPKGCAISHGNFLAEVDNAIEILHPVFRSRSDEELATLLFLPMSHVFGRMVAIACVRARVRLGHAPSLKADELLTLDPDGLTHWRQMNGKHPVPAELLIDDEELNAVLQRAIDEANKLVSRPESIRRFTILPTDFSEYAGHLTPSMKLRRETIMRDFADQVEGLYAQH